MATLVIDPDLVAEPMKKAATSSTLKHAYNDNVMDELRRSKRNAAHVLENKQQFPFPLTILTAGSDQPSEGSQAWQSDQAKFASWSVQGDSRLFLTPNIICIIVNRMLLREPFWTWLNPQVINETYHFRNKQRTGGRMDEKIKGRHQIRILAPGKQCTLLILTLSFLCFTARADAASVAHFTEQSDYIIHVFRLFSRSIIAMNG